MRYPTNIKHFFTKLYGRRSASTSLAELREKNLALERRVEALERQAFESLHSSMEALRAKIEEVILPEQQRSSSAYGWLYNDVVLQINHNLTELKAGALADQAARVERLEQVVNWLHEDVVLGINHRVGVHEQLLENNGRDIGNLGSDFYRLRRSNEVNAQFYEIRIDNLYMNLNRLISRFPEADEALVADRVV